LCESETESRRGVAEVSLLPLTIPSRPLHGSRRRCASRVLCTMKLVQRAPKFWGAFIFSCVCAHVSCKIFHACVCVYLLVSMYVHVCVYVCACVCACVCVRARVAGRAGASVAVRVLSRAATNSLGRRRRECLARPNFLNLGTLRPEP